MQSIYVALWNWIKQKVIIHIKLMSYNSFVDESLARKT